MKIIQILLLVLLAIKGYSSELGRYMDEYRTSGVTLYAKETSMLASSNAAQLMGELRSFCTDSVLAVRQKAYYLAYKKGVQETQSEGRALAVKLLLNGLNDANGGVVGQALNYLQEFHPADFDNSDKNLIGNELVNYKMPHFAELTRLAGTLNTGKEALYKHWLNLDMPQRARWSVALALARMGSAEHTAYCMSRVQAAPVNNNLVAYLLPDIVYTRQREAIDFCFEIIKSDEKNCYTLNPDKPAKILCAYQVMALLAPVVVNFPARVDVTGSLDTNDYDKLLATVRKWIDENKDYQVVSN